MMRVFACMLFLLLSLPAQADDQAVDIDMATISQTPLKQGIVNGPDSYAGRTETMDQAAEMLRALHFGAWRFSGAGRWGYGGDIYGFVVRDYKFRDGGAQAVFNLQDVFNAKYGRPVKIGKLCRPRDKSCFFSFDTLRAAWGGVLEEFLKDAAALQIDYLDLLGEPDLHSFENVSREEVYILLKDAWTLAKKYRPAAKIVLPSNAGFNEKVYDALLAALDKDGLHPDAISWHELGNDPDALPQHVAAFDALLDKYPSLCTPDCPEVHINEYHGEDTVFMPGHALGWLQQLEAAKVSQATRACWGGDAGSPVNYESCWQGFSGLLTPDSKTPQALYWVYKFYAGMKGARYAVANVPPKTAVLAGPVETGAQVMTGNYGDAPATLRLQLRNFKYSAALVDTHCVSHAGHKPQPVPDPPLIGTSRMTAQDQMLAIERALQPGEACFLTIRPQEAG